MPLNPRPSDLTIDQLRSLWLNHKDPVLRRVIEEVAFRRLEAQRKQKVLFEVEKLYAIIHQAWKEEQELRIEVEVSALSARGRVSACKGQPGVADRSAA